jgi:hypothetical protein
MLILTVFLVDTFSYAWHSVTWFHWEMSRTSWCWTRPWLDSRTTSTSRLRPSHFESRLKKHPHLLKQGTSSEDIVCAHFSSTLHAHWRLKAFYGGCFTDTAQIKRSRDIMLVVSVNIHSLKTLNCLFWWKKLAKCKRLLCPTDQKCLTSKKLYIQTRTILLYRQILLPTDSSKSLPAQLILNVFN